MFFAIDLLDILSLPSLLGTSKGQNMLEEPFSATLEEACRKMRLSCSRRKNLEGSSSLLSNLAGLLSTTAQIPKEVPGMYM